MQHGIEIAKAKHMSKRIEENWLCLVLCVAAVDTKNRQVNFSHSALLAIDFLYVASYDYLNYSL